MPSARLLTLVAIVALSPIVALPQETPPKFRILYPSQEKSTKEVDDARRKAQADAVARFPRLLRRARKIDDPADRARLLESIAETAWDRDRALARRLYAEAFDAAGLLRATPSEDPARRPSRAQVRRPMIQKIAWRDAGLARDLLERSAAEPGGGFGHENDVWPGADARGEALAAVAACLVATDPEEAARLGRESLRYGVSCHYDTLLEKLSEATPRLERELFFAALSAFAVTEDEYPQRGSLDRYVLGDLAQAGRPGPTAPDQRASADAVKADLAGPYLEAVRQAAERYLPHADADGAEAIFGDLTDLMPAFDRYDAEHAAEARELLERAGARLDPLSRKYMFVYYDDGATWQSVEADADACERPGARRDLLEIATSLAVDKREYDEALRLASRIDDPKRQESAVESVWGRQIREAIESGRIDEAIRLANETPGLAPRIRQFLHICTSAPNHGQARQTAGLLDELELYLLSCGIDVSPERACVHLRLAGLRSRFDTERAFGVAERAAQSVNICTATPRVADDRPVIWSAGHVDDPLADFGWSLVPDALARADYFRAMRIALSYDAAALSIAAQLQVVRTALPAPAPQTAPARSAPTRTAPSA